LTPLRAIVFECWVTAHFSGQDGASARRRWQRVFALHIDGHAPTFDLDVFEVPCADAEWYD